MDKEEIAAFCRKNRIRRLALFGSVLGSDFCPDGDVDVLVEFEAGSVSGLFGIARMAVIAAIVMFIPEREQGGGILPDELEYNRPLAAPSSLAIGLFGGMEKSATETVEAQP